MDSPPPPDPYEALGLKKDCTLPDIKKAHRGLVLNAHPDKFLDPVVKAQKTEEFTKIQQAYELLCDDERRRNYDDRIRLAELRREMMERRAKQAADGLNVKTGTRANSSAYTTRTAAPSFAAPKPAHPVYEDDDVRSSSRKHDGYERSPRASKTTSKQSTTEKLRAEKEKERDRAKRSERASKKIYDDSDSDDRRYEEKRERRRREEDRYARDEPKKSSRDDEHYAPRDKVQSAMEEAKRHMKQSTSSREHRSERPAPTHRSSSYARAEPSRDDVAYRSSSSSKYKTQEKGARRYQEIVEEPTEEPRRTKPSLNKSQSSPADIDISNLRSTGRAQTYHYSERDRDTSPPKPSFKRSQTERVDRHREEEPSARHSKNRSYRYGEREDSGYSSSGTPENRQSQWSNTTNTASTQKPSKSYPTAQPVIPEEEDLPRANFTENTRPQAQQAYTAQPQQNLHPQYYETRAPGGASSKRYTSSPERVVGVDSRSIPIVQPTHAHSRSDPRADPRVDSRGVEQRGERKIQYTYAHRPGTDAVRPSLQSSQTYTAIPNLQHTSSNPTRLFGEVRQSRDDGHRSGRDPRDREYGAENVQYAPKYRPEDVAYSRGAGRDDEGYRRGYEDAMRSKGERSYAHPGPHPGLERRHTSQVNAYG